MPNNANVDERVVEMRIDNRQFVSGAEKTIGILDKLKSALNFKNAGDGFNDVQRAADKVDLSGIAKDLDTLTSRFSTMGIAGMRVIQNLTDSITGFATNMIKGLTIAPISEGFQKYEEIARYTATIMGATRTEEGMWGDGKRYATQLEYVEAGLEQLTWYADQTSAAMTDMVSNVSKFTNAGVEFEQAVVQMQGVTNWGYQAGADKAEQARAMYNLSQAIAQGSVKLMDWKSITNANMATIEFKQTVLDTAAKAGTLKKSFDKAGNAIYKTLKGTEVNVRNFDQTLSEGWFSGNVLQNTLKTYGQYSADLYNILHDTRMEDFGIDVFKLMDMVEAIQAGDESLESWHDSLVAVMGDAAPTVKDLSYAFERLTSKENELSKRAFEAGFEYKTFADAIDATKDAVSTGWMKTFQLVIGNSEEAKEVWSAIGEELLKIFSTSGNTRNAILGFWKDTSKFGKGYSDLVSGYVSLRTALANLYQGVKSWIAPIVDAFRQVFTFFNPDYIEESAFALLDITYRFEEWTSKIALSTDACTGLTVVFEKVFGLVKSALGLFKPFFKVIGVGLGYLKDFVELFFSSFASGSFDSEYFLGGFNNLFGDIIDRVKGAWAALIGFLDEFKSKPAVAKTLDFIVSSFDKIKSFLSFGKQGTSGALEKMTDAVGKFTSAKDPTTVFEKIAAFWDSIVSKIKIAIGDTDKFRELFGKVGEIVSTVFEGIVGDPEAFKERIKQMASKAIQGLKEALSEIKLSDIFEGAKTGTMLYIALQFAQFVTSFKKAATEFKSIPEAITGTFDSLKKAIDAYGNQYKADNLLKMAGAILAVAGAMWILSKIDPHQFALIAMTLAGFFLILSHISDNLSQSGKQLSNNKKIVVNVLPKFAAGLIAIAILLIAAASSIAILSKIATPDIWKAFLAIVAIMALAVTSLVILSKKMEKDVDIKAIGKMVTIALVIRTASKAMARLKDMDTEKIIVAAFGFAMIIAAIALALYTMKENSVGSGVGAILGLSAIISAMYFTVLLLLGVVKMVEKYGTKIAWALGVMAVIAALIVGVMFAVSKIGQKGGSWKGAAILALMGVAFITFAAALAIAVPVILAMLTGLVGLMIMLEDRDAGKMWKGVFVLIGLSVALVALSAAAAVFAIAAVLIAAAMAIFGAGFIAAATAVGILTVALVPFGYALVEFCNVVAENGKVLVSMVAVIITAILGAIIASKAKIGLTIVMVILTVIAVIHQFGPQILTIVGAIITDLLSFILTLVPMIVDFILLTLIMIFNSAADGIRTNSGAIISAIENLLSAIIELVIKAFLQMAGDVLGGLWTLVAGLIGMDSEDVNKVGDSINGAFEKFGDNVADGVNHAFGGAKRDVGTTAEDLITEFKDKFSNGKEDVAGAVEDVVGGVTEMVKPAITDAGTSMGTGLTAAIPDGINTESLNLNKAMDSIVGVMDRSEDTATLGNNFSVSYINNIYGTNGTNHGQEAYDAAYWLTNSAVRGGADGQDSHSPSKMAAKLGSFFVEGYVEGISANVDTAYSTAESLAIKMGEALRNALATVQTLADEDFDLHPRITPVVDMTDVNNAVGTVNGLLSSGTTARMSQIGRNMANLDEAASTMSALSEARANVSQDVYEVNIYPQPGMDEEMIADAVIVRLNSGLVRKGVALG